MHLESTLPQTRKALVLTLLSEQTATRITRATWTQSTSIAARTDWKSRITSKNSRQLLLPARFPPLSECWIAKSLSERPCPWWTGQLAKRKRLGPFYAFRLDHRCSTPASSRLSAI